MSATEKRVRGLFSNFSETAFSKDGGVFSVKKASLEDAPSLASLYAAVAVTAENADERLSDGGENSFSQVGGMFVVPTESELEGLISDGEEFLTVSRDGVPFALMRAASEVSPPGRFEGTPPGAYAASGKVVEGGEIIVLRGRLREAAPLLFYLTLNALAEKGFLYHVGEVYRVTSYDDGRGKIRCDLFNRRSFCRMLKTGAVYIGDGPEKTVFARGLSAVVRPSLVCWEVPSSAKSLGKTLSESGIEI